MCLLYRTLPQPTRSYSCPSQLGGDDQLGKTVLQCVFATRPRDSARPEHVLPEHQAELDESAVDTAGHSCYFLFCRVRRVPAHRATTWFAAETSICRSEETQIGLKCPIVLLFFLSITFTPNVK